jgi:hypothetical protein
MISLNNSVGNLKGTPAMITDTLANRPSASSLAVGTIFIDSATGNWYQVGTNNTWSSTGGSGGSSTLQQVLDNGNSAIDQTLTITNSDTNSYTTVGQASVVMVDYDNGTVSNLNPNVLSVQNNNSPYYPKASIIEDTIKIENQINVVLLHSGTDNTFIPYLAFNNVSLAYTQYITPRTTVTHDNHTDQTYVLPYNNRGTLTFATQEICGAPTGVNINLSTGDFTPNLYNEIGSVYWIVITGSGTNGIVLNSTFIDYVPYTFLNQVNNTTFKTNTGGTIYGIHTSLPAGIITIIKSGIDFYVTHP